MPVYRFSTRRSLVAKRGYINWKFVQDGTLKRSNFDFPSSYLRKVRKRPYLYYVYYSLFILSILVVLETCIKNATYIHIYQTCFFFFLTNFDNYTDAPLRIVFCRMQSLHLNRIQYQYTILS